MQEKLEYLSLQAVSKSILSVKEIGDFFFLALFMEKVSLVPEAASKRFLQIGVLLLVVKPAKKSDSLHLKKKL